MKDINVLMPIPTALAVAAVVLETSLEEISPEDVTFDDLRVVLTDAQAVIEWLASLPPEVLGSLDPMVRRRSAHRPSSALPRGSHRRPATRLH